MTSSLEAPGSLYAGCIAVSAMRQVWRRPAVRALIRAVGRSPQLPSLMSSTTAPCREAWEGVLLDMGEAGRGWSVQQVRSKWKVVKAAFHRERAYRHASGEPSSQPPPQYRKLMRMWVRAGRPEYGNRRYTPAMIRMGQRRQRPRRRAVVEEEPEEEAVAEEAEMEEVEEAEAEAEAEEECDVEVVAEEEAAEGPHMESEASGLELEEPQHQEEEFHHQEEVLEVGSEGDSELEIVDVMDQLPSRAPLGLPLPSPGWSVPAIGQQSATVDRQVQTSPGLDLEEGELPSSPEPGEREPGCREVVQQLRAQVAAQEQQLHHLQNNVIRHLQQNLAHLNQALHQLWERNRRLQDMLDRLLQQDLQ